MKSSIMQSERSNCLPSNFIIKRGVRLVFGPAVFVGLLCLPLRLMSQVEVTADFDGLTPEAGWTHYDPATAGGQTPSWTFVDDGSGSGKAYRMMGPPLNCAGLFNRGGSYRSEQYTEFFYSVDILNFDPNPYGSFVLLGSRIASPGAGTTQGYVAGYSLGGPRQRQELFVNIGFSGEIISYFLDLYRGGSALTPQFPASRKLRAVFAGTNVTFKAELYDRTDLLEPLVRLNFQDAVHPDLHPNGGNLLGWLNLDMHSICDVTFDNYHATGVRNTPVGFPGVPQVVNLTPAPQTLFYAPPQNGSNITFNITTFTINQINTNTFRMFLNDVQIPSSQLVFTEIRDPLIGTPNTNFFVRYTGSLSSKTVYHGTIVVLDISGKGTTNNWYFDTFPYVDHTDYFTVNETGNILVEAEDYNYGGGQFQDAPPVSGTDETTTTYSPLFCDPDPSGCPSDTVENFGPQINGYPSGYFQAPGGMENVDYRDNTQRGINTKERQQYRGSDEVGTIQGTKGGGFDTPRPYRTVGASYVPDYIVADMNPGDWMNYTRRFPAGFSNYVVYLRASSQGRQDMRFDQVTSDPGQPNQTTALRGQFLVPNTESWTRWRYVPLTDAAGNIQTLQLAGPGVMTNTVRLTANEVRTANIAGDQIGDLQLNWMLFVPVTNATSTGPWMASAKPSKDSVNFDPAGIVEIIILNRDSSVTPGTIQLQFDGATVMASVTNTTVEGPGATVRYRPGLLLPNSVHSIRVVFGDGSTLQTNQWSFRVDDLPLIPPAHALAGSPDTAFTVQMHKATNGNPTSCTLIGTFENTIARAERQLAGQLFNPDAQAPFDNEVANQPDGRGIYTESGTINYEQNGGGFGNFGGDKPFPGITPGDPRWGTDPNHFAMAASIKLQLARGVYRMGVLSDDEFKVTEGPATGTELYVGSSETYPGERGPNQGQLPEFDFVVQSNGVYNFRLVYEEGGGGAGVEWYFVNRLTGTRRLINSSLPTIPCSFASPLGTGAGRGFNIQIHKATNDPAADVNFPNSSDRAERQLANLIIDPNTGQPYVNEAANTPGNLGLYMETNTINYEQNGGFAGWFANDKAFPGIPSGDPRWDSDPNHIAMAATTFLELAAGTYTFGVRSDDGFTVTVGPTLGSTNLLLGVFEGGRPSSETTFDFAVAASGLYPVRLVWYEGEGGADVEFYSFDPDTGDRILINDPNNAKAIKAYKVGGVPILNPRFSGTTFSFDFPTVVGKTYTVQYKNSLSDASWTDLPPSVVGDGAQHTVNYLMSVPIRFYRLSVACP